MANQLQKIIDFACKMGDRMIVLNTNDDQTPFVVMSFEEYENIMAGRSDIRGLSESQMLEKINREIAIWRSSQDDVYSHAIDYYSTRDLYPQKQTSHVQTLAEDNYKSTIDDWTDDFQPNNPPQKDIDFSESIDFEDGEQDLPWDDEVGLDDEINSDIQTDYTDEDFFDQSEGVQDVSDSAENGPVYVPPPPPVNPALKYQSQPEELPVINETNEFQEEPVF